MPALQWDMAARCRHRCATFGSGRSAAVLLAGWVAACAPPASDFDRPPGTILQQAAAPVAAAARPTAAGPAGAASRLDTFIGRHARVVWLQDVGDGTDIWGRSGQVRLAGLDSLDGRGERVIVAEPSSYTKPLIAPDGSRVVLSHVTERRAYAVDWNGGELRPLADGIALDVWRDPVALVDWVYVGTEPATSDEDAFRRVHRYRVDDPGVGELVWEGAPVGIDTFQLARDGRHAVAPVPWPQVGYLDLSTGASRILGEGCWTALARDGSLAWFLDGSHRRVTLVELASDRRWTVDLGGADAVGGYEIYHPRWANDPSYVAVTGPYTVGDGANRIRGGGAQVEVFVGRFSADFTAIAEWLQVTRNESGDFSPDLWVEPAAGQSRPAVLGPPAAPAAAPGGAAGSGARVVLDVRVRRNIDVPDPRSIAPYRRALQAADYDVADIVEGDYRDDRIVIAHWVIREARILDGAAREAGSTWRVTVEPYELHPELEGQRLIMTAEDVTLPLFYQVEPSS